MFAMITDFNNTTIFEYRPIGEVIWMWGRALLILMVLGLLVGFLATTFRTSNPLAGLTRTLRGFWLGTREIVLLPLGVRRILAIAILSFREAIRRRVLYVFALFLLPFLFVGWYLPNAEEGQLRFLVAFVMSAMTWLLLPLSIFLVAMTIPQDIRANTIQTLMTKPLTRAEYLFGRLFGFMAILTLVLASMTGISLFYLNGQVSDDVLANQWVARLPIYASSPGDVTAVNGQSFPLMFFRKGQFHAGGTNVGSEWQYRSHIEGASTDAAHWFFQFDPDQFAGLETVPIELTFNIFKTVKGDPTRDEADESGVWALLTFIDRTTGEAVYYQEFRVDNNRVNHLDIPARVFASGKLEVVARCLTAGHYLGMAPADLYILAQRGSFEWNFIKGAYSLWLKLLLVTSVALAASTFMSGFVAVLFTAGLYFAGLSYQLMISIVTGSFLGGGPFESAIRMFEHRNQIESLPPTTINKIALWTDDKVIVVYRVLLDLIPNLSVLDTTPYVAQGFDIPESLLLRNTLIVIGYVIPAMLAGVYCFRARELTPTS